jgi:hypothetical protein
MSSDLPPGGVLSLSPYLEAVRELFDRQADLVQQNRTIAVFIAGGAAVHWWTRERVTGDVDAEFGSRFVPDETTVRYVDNGIDRIVYLDRNFNPMMGLLHEDYQENAVPVGNALGGKGRFDIRVLAPVDLAISKLARWVEADRSDVRALAERHLIDADELERKAMQALESASGINRALVEINIREAVADVRRINQGA